MLLRFELKEGWTGSQLWRECIQWVNWEALDEEEWFRLRVRLRVQESLREVSWQSVRIILGVPLTTEHSTVARAEILVSLILSKRVWLVKHERYDRAQREYFNYACP